MRKIKGLFVSVSAAAMLVMAVAPVSAEETEAQATEAVTEAAEAAPAADESGLSEQDRQALEAYAQESITMVTSMSDEEMSEVLMPSSILSIPQDSVVQSVQSWQDNREELGAFTAVKSHEIDVTDDIISIATTCDFANGEGLVTTILDRESLSMDSMTFAKNESSMAKVMEEAALNTVMGLGIVFLMLLFLSFVIDQFKHISAWEASMKKRNESAPAAAPAAPAPVATPVVEEAVTDDGELIAVIAAAIAASEGTSTDGFVVRSIKRSNRNKWQRA